MPTRNVSLTPEQDAFIEETVRSGVYQNASEVMRDALRALQQRQREDALKLEILRREIQIGIDELERGEFIDVEDGDLESFLDSLTAPPAKGAR